VALDSLSTELIWSESPCLAPLLGGAYLMSQSDTCLCSLWKVVVKILSSPHQVSRNPFELVEASNSWKILDNVQGNFIENECTLMGVSLTLTS